MAASRFKGLVRFYDYHLFWIQPMFTDHINAGMEIHTSLCGREKYALPGYIQLVKVRTQAVSLNGSFRDGN